MERFVGKVVVIAGASSGIGAGIAQKLVNEGLIVIGLARRVELVQELADKLKGKSGKLHAIKCDVGDEHQLISTLESVESKFGPIHVLINNAAILNLGPLTNGYDQSMRYVMNINFMATVIATTETVKSMTKNKIDGTIINISSVAADITMPNSNMYGCSKVAVNYFSEVIRKDLSLIGSKIKISVVQPGMVSTGMVNDIQEFESFPRLDVEDVVNSVAYILSTPPNVQIQYLTVRPVGESF